MLSLPGRCGPVPPVPMYRGCIGIPNRTASALLETVPTREHGRLKTAPVWVDLNQRLLLSSPFLFHDHHLPHLQIIARTELVEIYTARHPLSQSVAAVPIRRTAPIRVIPRTLIAQIQFAHQRTVQVVDKEGHIGVVC